MDTGKREFGICTPTFCKDDTGADNQFISKKQSSCEYVYVLIDDLGSDQ